MDPLQLQQLQMMGMMGQQAGFMPGMMYPGMGGGASALMMQSQGYSSPIASLPPVDISPLAPLGLQNYGIPGMLAGMAGNTAINSMFQQHGVIPMGNAGSANQAIRTHNFDMMRRQVSNNVAAQDADAYYRTIEGMAALSGQPMNRQQQQAARQVSQTIAAMGPTIAEFNPEILDTLAGPRGSVQGMAAQMMQANRYRVDPRTGNFGFGAESNTAMVESLFQELYSQDNIAQMNGVRAGEAGQLFKELSNRGIITQGGSVRDRTLDVLRDSSDAQLDQISQQSGINLAGRDLDSLSNQELSEIRSTGDVQQRLTEADTNRISSSLRDYSKSISAIKEVFGENGNPNAPIPQLIGALEALTSGQMQKFDAAKLNLMVRDMQSLSQLSGKSVDQMLAMNQRGTGYLQEVGLGPHAASFSPASTNFAVQQGMAFQQAGGATGFGALSREQSEMQAQSLFARGLQSESANMYATLGRIDSAGGFADNDAGRKLQAIHDAAVAGETTYVDPIDGKEKPLPKREGEVRGLIAQGGAEGVGMSDFNQMLADDTANKRMMAEDERYQTIATTMQSEEFMDRERRNMSSRLINAKPLQGLAGPARGAATDAIAAAGQEALNSLSPQEQQDRELRQKVMSEAMQREAANHGVQLSDAEATAMAESAYGASERTANQFGMESRTAASQQFNPEVVAARESAARRTKSRSRRNEANSQLGPQGSATRRLVDAIQKQADRADAGEDVGIDTLTIDALGVENQEVQDKLIPELQAIEHENRELEKLENQLDDPTISAADKKSIQQEIERRTDELEVRTSEASTIANKIGLTSTDDTFGIDDVANAQGASRNLEHLARTSQVRNLALTSDVTDADIAGMADTAISEADITAIANKKRADELQKIKDLTVKDLVDGTAASDIVPDELKDQFIELRGQISDEKALEKIQAQMQSELPGMDTFISDAKKTFEGEELGGIKGREIKEAIIRSRRARAAGQAIPDSEAISGRIAEMKKAGFGDEISALEDLVQDQDYFNNLTPEAQQALKSEISDKKREKVQQAEDMLLAETQLKSLGMLEEGQSLMTDAGLDRLPAEIADKVRDADVLDRAGIVSEFIDSQAASSLQGTPEERAKARANSIAQFATASGSDLVSKANQEFSTMSDLRKEMLEDDTAVGRIGADKALELAQKSKDASSRIQTLANKYFGGDVGLMQLSKFQAVQDPEQLREDFSNLDTEQRKEVFDRLKAAGLEPGSVDDLSVGDFQAFLQLDVQDNMQNLQDANKEMQSAASDKALAERMGVSTDQLELVKEISGFEEGIDRDAEARAKELGISAEDYAAIAKGEKDFDGSLRLFKGKDRAKDLQAARDAEREIADKQTQLKRQEAAIERTSALGGNVDGLIAERDAMQQEVAAAEGKRNELMVRAGLDPTKPEDRAKYQKLLESQGSVDQLERRNKEAKGLQDKATELGLDDKKLEEASLDLKGITSEQQEKLDEFKDLDLTENDILLADAFGVDSGSREELAAFKKDLAGTGTGSISERNQDLLAGTLSTVDKIKGLEGDDALTKFDTLMDEFRGAKTSSDKKALARKYKMSVDDLEDLTATGEGLGIDFEGLDMADMTAAEKSDAAMAGLVSKRGKDIAMEVQKEQDKKLKLEGVLEVVGVVNGEGTLNNVTGSGGTR